MASTIRLCVVFDDADDFTTNATEVAEFERVEVDHVSVAEADSCDAVSQLGSLAAIAAIATTMPLASAIVSILSRTRTPTLPAMTVARPDSISRGRYKLGDTIPISVAALCSNAVAQAAEIA